MNIVIFYRASSNKTRDASVQLHANRQCHLQALVHSKEDVLKSADSRDLGCQLTPCTAQRHLHDALLRCGGSVVVVALVSPGVVARARPERSRCRLCMNLATNARCSNEGTEPWAR
jgi:hypothetical protein